jgi:DegV family protein with EDD domain
MKDYVIVTDSCCDMPRSYMDEKQIPFVSLTCNFLGNEHLDDFGTSLSYENFYEGMRNGEIPKTSQPNADAFYKVFEKIVKDGKSILYVGVSSGLSGTYNSANIAKNMILDEYPDAELELVDTLTASLGQGLMLIKALEMKNNGASLEDVKSFILDNRLRLNTYITVDDLNHLKRGGRISSTAAIFGTLLHIKPILTLNDEGKVIAIHKAKGRKSAINKLAEFVCKKIENPEEETICISHGDIEADALKLKEAILSEIKVKEVLINPIGPVVGTYGGPGALALFFLGKHRQNHLIDVNLK